MSDGQPSRGMAPGLAVAAVAVGFAAALCGFQVRQGEVAVLTTFGRPSRPYTEPGLYAKLPWPIQGVARLDGRLQVLDAPLQQTFTGDEQHLLVELFAAWRVSDPLLWLQRVGTPESARQRLRNLLDTQRSAVMGKYALGQLITTDGKQSRFEAVESDLLAAVEPEAEKDGMRVELVGIRRLALPETVTVQVLERMKQERLRLAAQRRAEGSKQADLIRSRAMVKAGDISAKAEADAIRTRAAGERAASEAYTAFQQKPELAGFLAELHALEGIAGDPQTTLVLPSEGPVLRLFREQGLALPGGRR